MKTISPDPEPYESIHGPDCIRRMEEQRQAEKLSEPPILSLEDRAFVALAARGNQRIGQFIERALINASPLSYGWWLRDIPDENFVLALEAAVGADRG